MKKIKFDYRHIICILITVGFILCGTFVFPYAIGRLIESIRDFGLSATYYFTQLFEVNTGITPHRKQSFEISLYGSVRLACDMGKISNRVV